jgi:uncharacterized protein (DUF924 family)
VLDFWFEEIKPKQWWVVDENLDKEITRRFGELHRQASVCELVSWRTQADGRLAEIIVLDQFSRNIYRNTPQAFLQDSLALCLAQEAVEQNIQAQLNDTQRSFLYMPFMHSESKFIHQQALELFSEPQVKSNLNFELRHKAIIDRFGRYPHRNEILGRESTMEELEFLKQPGSKF